MGLIFAIIVGLIVGAIGGTLLRENYDYLILDCLIGIGGAIVGDALYFILTGASEILLFSWGALLTELLVAATAVMGFNFIHRPKKEIL